MRGSFDSAGCPISRVFCEKWGFSPVTQFNLGAPFLAFFARKPALSEVEGLGFSGGPFKPSFGLSWGSLIPISIPLQFPEQQMHILRHNHIPINLKLETAPQALQTLTQKFLGPRR